MLLISFIILECHVYTALVCLVLSLLLSRCSSFDGRRNSRANHSREIHCRHSWPIHCWARKKNSKMRWIIHLWRLRMVAATVFYSFLASKLLKYLWNIYYLFIKNCCVASDYSNSTLTPCLAHATSLWEQIHFPILHVPNTAPSVLLQQKVFIWKYLWKHFCCQGEAHTSSAPFHRTGWNVAWVNTALSRKDLCRKLHENSVSKDLYLSSLSLWRTWVCRAWHSD